MPLRHECKHEVNEGDLVVLRQRLSAVLPRDTHAQGGSYRIRSLYFDTPRDKALREKLESVNNREKFRIRCYNDDYTNINLEKKVKTNGLGYKRKARLSADQVQAILNGDISWLVDTGNELLGEFYVKMLLDRLEPKSIVDYTREPFTYEAGNVRVTLDTDIRTGLRSTDFLNPDIPTIPVKPGIAVLEVKWDEYLPEFIRKAVGLKGRRTTAFSKYAASRMYD